MVDTKSLEKQAIKTALEGKWEQSIKLNQKLLKEEPKNIPALNRLARAFWEKDELAKAKKTYQQVLSLDPYNPIAAKNLKRIVVSRKRKKIKLPAKKPSLRDLFLEEPGKTKVVKLVRLAAPKVLAELDSSDLVKLISKRRLISVVTSDDIYLGSVPEDLSQRLLVLIKGGNRYEAVIKAVDRQHLEIFIKEVYRSPKFHNQPSFPATTSDFVPQPVPETIQEEEIDITPTGEEEETT